MANYEQILGMIQERVDDDTYMEGATIEVRKIFKAMKKEQKQLMKEIKQSIRTGNYEMATKKIDQLETILKKAKKQIMEIDETWTSSLCGSYLYGIITMLKSIAVGFLTFGIGTVPVLWKDMYDASAGAEAEWKANGAPSTNSINFMRRKTLGLLEGYLKKLPRLKKEIMRYNKMTKTVRESEDVGIAGAIYESYLDDEIGDDEMTFLLEMANF